MNLKIRMLLITLSVLISAPCLAAADLAEKRSGDVVVRYHERDERKADQVLSAVEQIRQEIRDDLGIAFRKEAQIVLARGRRDFEEWAGDGIPGWAMAIARTKRQGIVINVAKTAPLLSNNLILTLRHELCHLALGMAEAEAGRSLPLWFHEGVAVWVSGGSHYANRRPFLVAAAHGDLIPLADLERRFPGDAAEAQLA